MVQVAQVPRTGTRVPRKVVAEVLQAPVAAWVRQIVAQVRRTATRFRQTV